MLYQLSYTPKTNTQSAGRLRPPAQTADGRERRM